MRLIALSTNPSISRGLRSLCITNAALRPLIAINGGVLIHYTCRLVALWLATPLVTLLSSARVTMLPDKSFKTYPIGYGKIDSELESHFRFPIGYKLPINRILASIAVGGFGVDRSGTLALPG